MSVRTNRTVVIDLTTVTYDLDGDPLSFAVTGSPVYGTLVAMGGG